MSNQTFNVESKDGTRQYVLAKGVSMISMDSAGMVAVSVQHPDIINRMIEFGLLVEVVLCTARKTFVPLPGQEGDMTAMEFTCDKPMSPPHRKHRDPRGVDWL